jgi:hypothetical protein
LLAAINVDHTAPTTFNFDHLSASQDAIAADESDVYLFETKLHRI